MDFENKKLKSSVELAMEKTEKSKPLKTVLEAGNERWKEKDERIAAEVKANEEDMEKIKAIAVVNGFNLEEVIAKKEEEIARLSDMAKENSPANENVAEDVKAETQTTKKTENDLDISIEEKKFAELDNRQKEYDEYKKEFTKNATSLAQEALQDSENVPDNMKEMYIDLFTHRFMGHLNSVFNESMTQEDAQEYAKSYANKKIAEEIAKKQEAKNEGEKKFTESSEGGQKSEQDDGQEAEKKGEQFEGDPIQGMENFINSQKEKSPITETFKEMLSFIKKKGAELNSDRLDVQDAISEFSKKSSEWAKKIFSGTEEIRKKEKINEMISRLGSSLEISDNDSVAVKKHLEHLSLLPENLLELMKNKGIKIKIGNKDVVGLAAGSADESYFKENSPGEARASLANWKGVPGCYYGGEKKIVFAGEGAHGCSSLILHEYGHGVGDMLGIYKSLDLIAAHKRLYDKLDSYEQQGGPGGKTGRQELVAESLSDFFMISKSKFIKKYDKEWYLYLEKSINKKFTV